MTRTPPSPTLFPYTTLFRSREGQHRRKRDEAVDEDQDDGKARCQNDFRQQILQGGARICYGAARGHRSEEHTSELQSRRDLVCRLLLEKKKKERKYIE